MARSFLTPVRGHAFAGRPPGAPGVGGVRPARLAREPDNPVDPLAVAVWLTEEAGPAWRVGYLDRLVAARLAPRLDRGEPYLAALEGWMAEPGGRWRRPAVRISPGRRVMAGTDPAPEAPRPVTPTRAPGATGGGVWARPPGVRRRRLSPRR